MYKKIVFFMLVLSFIFISSANAKSIVWVAMNWNADGTGTVNDDWQPWIDGLTAAGYTVDVRPGNWDALTQAKVNDLDTFDLILFSRAIQSGTYATNAAEVALWNSVSKPVLCASAYVLRKSRWNWIVDDTVMPGTNNGDMGSPLMQVVMPSHPIFYGITLDANNQLKVADPDLCSGQCSFHPTNQMGNGTLIAKTVPLLVPPTTSGGSSYQVGDFAWIAEWQKGVESYPGSGVVFPAHRLYFSAGTHETAVVGVNGGAANKASGYNLTPQGWTLFLNAVKYMIGDAVDPTIASSPNPANETTGVSRDVNLSWVSGKYADTHNVFFGTNINDVTNATLSDPLSTEVYTVDVNMLDIHRLAFGTTYYWRVDEVNVPSKPHTNTGGIWTFTTEPEGVELAIKNVLGVEAFAPQGAVYEDQEPNTTYNGSGVDANGMHSNDAKTMWAGVGDGPGDVWLQYELDQIYKLYQLKIWNYNEIEPGTPFAPKDVNITYSVDNVTWKALDEIQVFPKAPGESTYEADIFVDMNGAIAKYVRLTFLSSYTDDLYTGGISEIRFLVIPTRANTPSPEDKAVNVDLDSIISWKAGRNVGVHKVYIGFDKASVDNRDIDVMNETADPNYPIALGLNKTYYWRVDEVNEADEYTIWDGPVWEFSTQQSILIDGFEVGYGNDINTNAVFLTWQDGGILSTSGGSWMGRKTEPYLDTINHSGGHSAPMEYNNSSYSYSEVTAETSKLQNGSDWSIGSPTTMTIWFRGDPNTTVVGDSELYCKIGGKTAIYGGSIDSLKRDIWRQWDIDLAALGVNLSNIPQITIGIRTVGTVGGTGVIYLDDIMLTGVAPLIAYPDVFVEAEDFVTISAPLIVESNYPGASGGKYIKAAQGTANDVTSAPPTTGIATYNVNLPAGQYIIYGLASVETSAVDGFWVRVNGATTDVALYGTTGWARWNGISLKAAWHWDRVFTDNITGLPAIKWTIPGGMTSFDVAYRDTVGTGTGVNPKLDALLFVKVGE